MAKSKTSTSKKKGNKAPLKDYVVVSSKSYGAGLKGTKIYFEGKRPTRLKDDGTIGFGKFGCISHTSKFRQNRAPSW